MSRGLGDVYKRQIMDPPSYGRGANGEVWDIEKDLDPLISLCTELLSERPLFFLINSYTAGFSKEVLANLYKVHFSKFSGRIETEEIGLPITEANLVLPCGIYGRYIFDE